MAKLIYGGKTYDAEVGHDILGTLLQHQAPIMYICMSGSCGTCRVKVCKGGEHLMPPESVERRHFPGGDGTERLACQAVLLGTGDVEVEQ